jgi:CubicO group peptidase (beta-lactamase class C family)
LAERGELTLEDAASPSLSADITIKSLLTHTSGLPAVPTDVAPIAPGTQYIYSDTGYMLLGEVVARVSRSTLKEYAERNIIEPMGFEDTAYQPGVDRLIVRTSDELPAGAVHDPRAREMGGVAGHAGLFSTVRDLIRYAETIRKRGAPLLCRASQSRMAHSQIPPNLGYQSYGWFCGGHPYLPAADLFSDRSYGHSGFTGCLLLIDPQYDASIVLVTNRVLSAPDDPGRYLALRRRFLNAVAAAITS